MWGRSCRTCCTWLARRVLPVVMVSTCLCARAGAQQSAAAWAVLDRVREAYRDVYDLRFGYDAWIDYGDDGTIDVTKTGKLLFRLHEQAFIKDETWQYAGGQPGLHYISSMLRGNYATYTKEEDDVQGVLYRSREPNMWAWGAGGLTVLFAPLLIDRQECVAFLFGYERIGLRKCARVVMVMRNLLTERQYRELVAMAERGELPEDRFGENYWIDTSRGVVLKYESVAYSDEPGKERSELTTWTTRVHEVRRFRSGDVDIWLPVEVEEIIPPFWRHGPVGKVKLSRGYKKRIVVVPDTVEINLRAPDEAYVIDPPPGTRLQEPGEDVDVSKLAGAKPAESVSGSLTVTKKMMEEAERQLRERGLRPVEPVRGNWWRIGALVAGAILVVVGLWFRRGAGG